MKKVGRRKRKRQWWGKPGQEASWRWGQGKIGVSCPEIPWWSSTYSGVS